MKLKMVHVGLGAHGRGVNEHFVLRSPDFECVGLVDRAYESLKTYAAEQGVSEDKLYEDYREAFREAGADAAMISVPSPLHYEVCKDALEQGLHIIVEKPFALSMKEAEDLVRIAEDHNVKIMVSQNYRYFPVVLTLKKAMDEHSLGRLLFVNGQFFCAHDGKPYQRQMQNYILLEMAVHHVDMIRFLLASDIKSVLGRTWNTEESGYAGDPNVNAVYETESGVTAVYTSSLLAKGMSMPWEGVWRIQYEQGSIYLDDLGEGYGVYIIGSNGEKTKLPMVMPERESIHGVLHDFSRAIIEDRDPAVSGKDNLKTLAALFATNQSSKQGALVKL